MHQIGMHPTPLWAFTKTKENKSKNKHLKINFKIPKIGYVFVRTYQKTRHPSPVAKCFTRKLDAIVTQCVAALYNAHWFQFLRKMYGNKSPCPSPHQQ